MNLVNEINFDIPIKTIILQAGIAGRAADICSGLGKTLLICDENTKDFVSEGNERIILPGNQKPELELARELSKHQPDYFIAVGSGSLNDVVKYASFLAGKPYIVFGTAPSMNGYVSANVSLLENGYKKSFFAKSPEAAYFDLEILENAPKRLRNSGIGDAICRSVAQSDAILSTQVTGSPLYEDLFALLKKYEADIFDDIEALTKTLVFGGIAMLLAKSSAPASQGEHMLAHYMELMQPNAPQSYHGEQIAVTTVTMAKLQERLLSSHDYVEINSIPEDEINKHFGDDFGKYCSEQTHKKYDPILGKKIKINRQAIEKNLIKLETIRKKLENIGAPVEAKNIGWDKNIYENAIKFTRYTRDRFTFLDLV